MQGELGSKAMPRDGHDYRPDGRNAGCVDLAADDSFLPPALFGAQGLEPAFEQRVTGNHEGNGLATRFRERQSEGVAAVAKVVRSGFDLSG
jgi:hypothetical protein